MPPLVFFESFLGFQLQDKHNASFLLFTRNVFGHELPQSDAKVRFNYELLIMNYEEICGIC